MNNETESPKREKISNSLFSNNNFSESNSRNRIFIKTTENSILNNNLQSPKNFDINPNYTKKYNEDYSNCILNLKEKIHITNSIIVKKSYDGLKSYEIPHIHNRKNSENYRINLIRENLEKTLKFNKNNKFNNDDINQVINEENSKMKMYINNLEKFAVMNSPKFPNIIQITNMNKLKTSNVKVSNNRYMGSRYDPNNYN